MDESQRGPEVHVHRPEVPEEDAKKETEEEKEEEVLEVDKAFMDLDQEGESSFSNQRGPLFLHRHVWVETTIKIVSNPIFIIFIVLILITWCARDMMNMQNQAYIPPVQVAGSIISRSGGGG